MRRGLLCAAAGIAASAFAVVQPRPGRLPSDQVERHRHLPGLGRQRSDQAVPCDYKAVSKPVPTFDAALAVRSAA